MAESRPHPPPTEITSSPPLPTKSKAHLRQIEAATSRNRAKPRSGIMAMAGSDFVKKSEEDGVQFYLPSSFVY
ncbi:hypothetical protein L1887_32114 [Cichorium endivia]|nr:hypothetical protein L1887_32114 [Cichorium endivia]